MCPATMTIQRDELLSVMKNAGDYNYHGGAHLVGINTVSYTHLDVYKRQI